MASGKNRIFWVALITLLLALLTGATLPNTASAHATLLKADPEQGGHLAHSPSKVLLVFNERLGGNLYKLQVLDNKGKSVTDYKAKLSQKHRKLTLKLPSLKDGVYTVTYKVISADGHPVGGSYTFSIGDTKTADTATQSFSNHGGRHHFGATFLVRIGYYLALLFLTGWIFWGMLFQTNSEKVQHSFDAVSRFLKGFYLFMALGLGFVEFSNLLGGLGPGKIVPLFFSSAVGLSFIISLTLAILSFWILGRTKWIDGIWLGILLAAEAFNGHAFVFPPIALTVFLDFVHLLAAAIWSGGLLYLIYFWKQSPDHARRFLPLFSKTALISMILLVVTGILNTFLFLPSVQDVLYTWWGRLLILKTALVVSVIVTGALIRFVMKKNTLEKAGPRVKVDFTLMIAILVIVGIFTYLNPTPTNKPLTWTANKNHMSVTAEITPKAPAVKNTFTVLVTLPKKPHHVRLVLKYMGKQDFEPISKTMRFVKAGQNDFTYRAKQNIPFPGKWGVRIYVLDSHDNVTQFKKGIKLFPDH